MFSTVYLLYSLPLCLRASDVNHLTRKGNDIQSFFSSLSCFVKSVVGC